MILCKTIFTTSRVATPFSNYILCDFQYHKLKDITVLHIATDLFKIYPREFCTFTEVSICMYYIFTSNLNHVRFPKRLNFKIMAGIYDNEVTPTIPKGNDNTRGHQRKFSLEEPGLTYERTSSQSELARCGINYQKRWLWQKTSTHSSDYWTSTGKTTPADTIIR